MEDQSGEESLREGGDWGPGYMDGLTEQPRLELRSPTTHPLLASVS